MWVIIHWTVTTRRPTQLTKSMAVTATVSCRNRYPYMKLLGKDPNANNYLFTGCIKCYARDTVNTVNGKTMHHLHQDSVEKALYLKDRGFHVVEIWEYDIKQELEQDADMKTYIDNFDLRDPFEPRDAFFGGRTNAAIYMYLIYVY